VQFDTVIRLDQRTEEGQRPGRCGITHIWGTLEFLFLYSRALSSSRTQYSAMQSADIVNSMLIRAGAAGSMLGVGCRTGVIEPFE